MRILKSILVPIILALTAPSLAFAQQQSGSSRPPPPVIQNPSGGANIGGDGLVDFFSSRTPLEFWLTCIIIAFGLIVLILLLCALGRVQDRRADDVARAVIVVTVIIGALILVTAGFNNEQTAPVFGLFGTIVGYILGRMSRKDESSDTSVK